MNKNYKEVPKIAAAFLLTFLKWLLLSALMGALGGLVGSAFHLSVSWAAAFRSGHPWLIYLLPAAGLVSTQATGR